MEIVNHPKCNVKFAADNCKDANGFYDVESGTVTFKLSLDKDALNDIIDNGGHIYYQLLVGNNLSIQPFLLTTKPLEPWEK